MPRCMKFIARIPAALWASIISGITAGGIIIGLALAASAYVDATEPTRPVLVPNDDGEVFELEPRAAGGYWLILHLRTDPSENCIKIPEHLLVEKAPGRIPLFYVLSSGLSGGGLQSHSEHNPGTGLHDFRIQFLIPADFSGDWVYQYRETYRCWPLGLLSHSDATIPAMLHIP